jgi:ASPIC and UnbV/FG-GAP-like repeat
MPLFARILAAGLICAVFVGVGLFALSEMDNSARNGRGMRLGQANSAETKKRLSSEKPAYATLPTFSEGFVDDSGFALSGLHQGPVADRSSIEQVCASYRDLGKRGRAKLLAELRQISGDGPARSADQAIQISRLQTWVGALHMYEGEFDDASAWFSRAMTSAEFPGLPPQLRANILAARGVAALRRGETENCIVCLGPSSCIVPIAKEAVHQFPSGSREAAKHFTAYLRERPEDLGVRWLLNVAHMTLGEYPDKVPKEFRIDPEYFRSSIDIGKYPNIAPLVGLNDLGPNMAGGSIFDDFNGDGLADVFTTSKDFDHGAYLFVNKGDGKFEDRSDAGDLKRQPFAVNCTHADYDNDGDLDVVITRGGWENAARLSLMRNRGDGTFEDVTVAAGMTAPLPSHSAAWRDFDNDGFIDLYVCGEFVSGLQEGLVGAGEALSKSDPNSRCRLYRNNGNGTFTDVADKAGVRNDRYAKGAAWSDYDDDGWPDLFVSNMGADNRLYHNNGDGTFTDVAGPSGVSEPKFSFSCWFWDYDNDGRFDLFVTGYNATMNEFAANFLGQPSSGGERPRLFRNLGREAGFRDVTAETGLDRVILPMGSNFADIDEDGYLDMFFSTGRPAYSALVPKIVLKNVEGKRFEDVSFSTGMAHLQKGHGVSFADWDEDGDLDLFVQMGGAVPGDRANNVLFQNPGHGRHWLKIKLQGAKTNRAAIGARIRVDLKNPDATVRSIHREISGGSSYGGNSLVAAFGLGEAKTITAVTIQWPTSRTTQVFHDVPVDRSIEITEGAENYKTLTHKPISNPKMPH